MTFIRFLCFCLAIGLGIWGITKIALADTSMENLPNAPVEVGKVLSKSSDAKKSLLPVETYFGLPSDSSGEEVLKRLQITVYPEDITEVFPDPDLGIGFTIRIFRALPVTIDDAGKKTIYRTFSETVADLIKEKSIELGDDDKISPQNQTKLSNDLTITIIRVEITQVKQKEPIDYKTVYKDDNTLDKGIEKIEAKGKKGERVKTYEVRRENNKETSRKLIKNEISKEPIDEVVIRGTKEVIYGTGKATWFGAPYRTAAHNSLPRGTMVEVKNLSNGKTVVVKIIGGGIMGSAIIDLSPDAFSELAPLGAGVIQVKLTKP